MTSCSRALSKKSSSFAPILVSLSFFVLAIQSLNASHSFGGLISKPFASKTAIGSSAYMYFLSAIADKSTFCHSLSSHLIRAWWRQLQRWNGAVEKSIFYCLFSRSRSYLMAFHESFSASDVLGQLVRGDERLHRIDPSHKIPERTKSKCKDGGRGHGADRIKGRKNHRQKES